ncbi:MAG TPA: toprim domain-containing protein, partial [Acidimicrobiales bacterium]|nr:toprim domain-containing protein [Acidimicrobiales bacterium]
ITLRYEGDDQVGAARQRNSELSKVMERAIEWYHDRLVSGRDAGGARAYLRSRGYDGETVRQFKLGWAPEGWDNLVRQLGAGTELLIATGLAFRNQAGRMNDSFRGRVLFPIYDAAGRPVGLGGRALPGSPGPKYKNTQGTALYDKSRILYGLNWAKASIVERGRVVVCEGYTDVIGLHRAGITEAVATCGTALAEGHVKLLTGFSRRIVLAYDADGAGQGAAEKFYDWEKRFEAEIRVVELEPGSDPADLAKSAPQTLRKAVEGSSPYLGFRLRRLFATADLANPEGRARAAEAAMTLIVEHPDVLVRDQYLMEVSDRCRLSPEQLRALANRTAAGSPSGAPANRVGQAAPPGQAGRSSWEERDGKSARRGPLVPTPAARAVTSAKVPLPELETLRLAVHHPELVAGRAHPALFRHDLARAAFEQLAASLTLHSAIDDAPPEVAELLSRLAVQDSEEDADDVLRRLVDRAAVAELAQLRRQARAPGEGHAGADLAAMSARAVAIQNCLAELRAIDPATHGGQLADAEQPLLALLLGSPSMSPGPVGREGAVDNW